jgi:phosphoketolase
VALSADETAIIDQYWRAANYLSAAQIYMLDNPLLGEPLRPDHIPVEGTWRAHQVPLPEVRTNPDHLKQLEEWLRSYRPQELFDEAGAPRAELLGLVPAGDRRLGSSPHANGGLLLWALALPDFRGPGDGASRAHFGADPGARALPARCHGRESGASQLPGVRS